MKAVKVIIKNIEGLAVVLSPREKRKNRELMKKFADLEEQVFRVKLFQKAQEESQ